jgi:hypothetical protein
MTFQPVQNLYGVSIGTTNGNGPSYPHYDVRAPTITDTRFFVGQEWVWENNGIWFLLGLSSAGGVTTANWQQVSTSTGDILSVSGTSGQITATTTAGAVVLSLPAAVTAPGSITSATTLTATLGNITATNGNLVLGTAGNKINIATGANSSVGTSAAMIAGTITVANTSVTAASKIFLTNGGAAGTIGTLSVGTIVPGTSFVINSSNVLDTSVVNYLIIN